MLSNYIKANLFIVSQHLLLQEIVFKGRVNLRNIINFLDRNWIRSLGNVLCKHYYPQYRRIDTVNIKALQTDYGVFHYSKALQEFPDVFAQIREYCVSDLQPNDVVLDIGANIGAFTILAAKKVKHVVAIEPLFYVELQVNIALNRLNNVNCMSVALGSGKAIEIDFCNKKQTVKTMGFKEIVKCMPAAPTVLKIDCEGGEWCLQPQDFEGIRIVEAEIHNFNKRDPHDFKNMLLNLGYACEYTMTPDGQMMLHARK